MIYLDSAATTFQKPAAVQRAVARAMRTMSSPGRGGYAAAQQADELLFRCRSAAAELFSVPSSEQVVFTMNATHGLNISIKSLVRPCGRVVVSGYEHNAVTRPLHALGAEVIVAAAPLFFRRRRRSKPSSARLRMSPMPLSARMSPMSSALFYQLSASRSSAAAQACRSSSTRLNPRARCRSTFPRSRPHSLPCRGIKDFTARRGRGCCSVAATRSRSLRAAQAANRCVRACRTFFPTVWRQGRTTFLASRGLEAGIAFVRAQRPERIRLHSRALIRRAGEGLGKIPNVHGFLSLEASLQAGVLSFTVDGLSPESVAEEMAKRGIALRAGCTVRRSRTKRWALCPTERCG